MKKRKKVLEHKNPILKWVKNVEEEFNKELSGAPGVHLADWG